MRWDLEEVSLPFDVGMLDDFYPDHEHS